MKFLTVTRNGKTLSVSEIQPDNTVWLTIENEDRIFAINISQTQARYLHTWLQQNCISDTEETTILNLEKIIN